MAISKPEAQFLAKGITRVRPDWDYPGVLHAIGLAKDLGTPAAISAAFYRLADNAQIRTPAVLAEPGPHWGQTTTAKREVSPPCPDHPGTPVAKCTKPDGPCGQQAAAADREQGLEAMRAAVKDIARRIPQRLDHRSAHTSPALKAELDRIAVRRTPTQDDS